MTRIDETHHRLLEWTYGQAPSERLAAQVLSASGYADVDPSHPLGGPDGGRDGICRRGDETWIMAVYFPNGKQTAKTVEKKFTDDVVTAKKHRPDGVAFVTNQPVTMSKRRKWETLAKDHGVKLDIFHMERIAALLDSPPMHEIRRKFLDIGAEAPPLNIDLQVHGGASQVVDSAELREKFIELRQGELRTSNEEAAKPRTPLPPGFMAAAGVGEWPEPLDEDQLEEAVQRCRQQIERDWSTGMEYLAAHTLVGASFVVENMAESFLESVELRICVHNAKGVVKEDLSDFRHQTMLDPTYEPYTSPYSAPAFSNFRHRDYPISWANAEGALDITITLPQVRPGSPWTSDNDDVVILVVDPALPVTVTWTATARSYGTQFVGAPCELPMQDYDPHELLGPALSAEDGND